tara:strand:+ start:279 stop:410 length:132 start_codon:yes stop_codon:yes gene_type:complete
LTKKLEDIAEKLGGELKTMICSDGRRDWRKIEIVYDMNIRESK